MEIKEIDLLLIGGGHAHALFLRMWAMEPLPGVRVTLVSPESKTAYSGMLPGVLSGAYREDESHIDLVRLTAWAKVRFIRDSVVAIDTRKKLVQLAETGDLEFDYLSVNTGITPEMPRGFSSKVVGVKPTAQFLKAFHKVLNDFTQAASQMKAHPDNSTFNPSSFNPSSFNPSSINPSSINFSHGLDCSPVLDADLLNKPMKIAVVGGGASGIEVAINLAMRLHQGEKFELFPEKSQEVDGIRSANSSPNLPPKSQTNSQTRAQKSHQAHISEDPAARQSRPCEIVLIHSGNMIGPNYSKGVRRLLEKQLNRLGIEVKLGLRIEAEIEGKLIAGNWQETFDHIFWATQAGAPSWLKQSGLMTDSRGFLKVGRTLQSLSHPFVFGAGDVVAVEGSNLAKSGVYAVRAAPVLFSNLKRFMSADSKGKQVRLKNWRPQTKFLSLIGIAGRTAIAGRGSLALQGRFFWWLKDQIDRRFMAKFEPSQSHGEMIDHSKNNSDPMVCKGCAAKVSPSIMAAFLDRPLSKGVGEEDASAMLFGNQRIMASIDRLTDIVSDPYRFGQIAVNHSMSDLFATLSAARYFLASVELSKDEKFFHLRDLKRLMAGITSQAKILGAELISAHTSTGDGLAVSLAVMGSPSRDKVKKSGGRKNDLIILTKPLGTGVVFAAIAQNKGLAKAYDEALNSMLLSNRSFSEIFSMIGVEAVTDVTGFGLVGHLLELMPEGLSARLEFSNIPRFSGVDNFYRQGVKSSAHQANGHFSSFVTCLVDQPETALLYDPQTSGGLLANVSVSQFERIKSLAIEQNLGVPWIVGSLGERAEKSIVVAP